jgi:hypothetical protein
VAISFTATCNKIILLKQLFDDALRVLQQMHRVIAGEQKNREFILKPRLVARKGVG